MKNYAKRKKIRIISFLTAIIIGLSAFSLASVKKISNYKTQISIWEQSSLSSLASYIDTIKTTLYKGLYANTSNMTGKLSDSLLQCSAASLECLQRLPSGDSGLNNVYKFLTQVSAFTQSLNTKVTNKEKITEKEYENMEKLFKYASSLSTQIDYMQEVMLCGNMDFQKEINTLSFKAKPTDLSMSYTDTINSAEDSFTDFPSLIYDGPFSDDILSKESEFLKNKQELSKVSAEKKCAEYLSLKPENLAFKGEEKSNCNSYIYSVVSSGRQSTAAVTKNGGYLSYIISDAYTGESKYNAEEAIKAGIKFLEKCGYKGMKSTYYSTNDGICTINYAYNFNSYTCYPDLIKVNISLSDLSVTGLDARTYLMNHRERTIPENIITPEKAMESVSTNLSIQSYSKCIIPTDSNKEKNTYEFKCKGPDGDDVLVYIDMLTAQEDEILILLYSDGGILTK